MGGTLRLSIPSKHERTCGAISQVVLLLVGLTALAWHQYHQAKADAVVLSYSVSSIAPNLLIENMEVETSLRPASGLNWPAIKVSGVSLAAYQAASAAPNVAVLALTSSPQVPTQPEPTIYQKLLNSKYNGDVYVYRDEQTQTTTADLIGTAAADIPTVILDFYLEPGPDRVIYKNQTALHDVSHAQTAVFLMQPGTDLSLTGCDFSGGVMVYIDKPIGAATTKLNKVILKGGTKIGGGSGGVGPNIGLVAPGCELSYFYAGSAFADQIDIDGFTVLKKIGNAQQIRLDGVVLVLDENKRIWQAAIESNPEIVASISSGIGSRLLPR